MMKMRQQISWPEPIVRVQSLSDSGIKLIPECYIRRPSDRPSSLSQPSDVSMNIPVININDLSSDATRKLIASASRDWGFFQVVNHGVNPEVLSRSRSCWRDFFEQPSKVKQAYANEPSTYFGYGSRLGVEKGATLDWGDYFYLNYLPLSHRQDQHFWSSLPTSWREVVEEYGEEMAKLSGKLLRALSVELGLEENYLKEAFGGDEVSATIRANFYPKCPQPDLTLGLSPHSDPGGLTLILPDPHVSGLQVFRDNTWFTINPIPNAIIVNIGDQIQILSNAIYKSVEHRVLVNPDKERLSVAFFYNPKGNLVIQPAEQIVSKDRPALYAPNTYDEYRVTLFKNGPRGKRLQ